MNQCLTSVIWLKFNSRLMICNADHLTFEFLLLSSQVSICLLSLLRAAPDLNSIQSRRTPTLSEDPVHLSQCMNIKVHRRFIQVIKNQERVLRSTNGPPSSLLSLLKHRGLVVVRHCCRCVAAQRTPSRLSASVLRPQFDVRV